MEESKLKILRSRREYVFRAMQILYDLAKEMVQDRSKVSAFKSRYTRLHSIRDEFVQLCDDIQSLELAIKPNQQIDQNLISSFDELYYEVISAADALTITCDLSMNRNAQLDDESSARPPAATSLNARLPKLELPKFDGNIQNWQTFYDTYTTLIHDNNIITDIEKFHYLVSCLHGHALSIAKGVPMTASNYKVVFDTLVERYQNKRILALTYLDKFLNQPAVKSGSFQELQALTNLLHESFYALQSLNIPNLGEFILFHLASRTLDADTRKRFESQNRSRLPTMSDLLKFFQDYVNTLETSL